MERRRIGNVAFVDTFLLLLLTTLALINPPVDPTIELRPKAILTITWDDYSRSDVDIHIIDPSGNHLNYTLKDVGGQMVLTRDDTGASFDSDGVLIAVNVEVVEFHALQDGEYIVYVRMFSKNPNHHSEDIDLGDTSVIVEMNTLSPFNRVFKGEVYLAENKQTISVFSFTVKDGVIVDVNDDVDTKLP